MQSQNLPDPLDQVIHKESNQRKLKAKGLSPIVPMANSPIGLGYHSRQEAAEQGSIDQLDNRQNSQLRTHNQLKNFQIDEYLYELINENMIDERFKPFFAKACHVLGIQTINRLKVNAYNGNDKQKLFAYKVKGALQLHYKQEFEREP